MLRVLVLGFGLLLCAAGVVGLALGAGAKTSGVLVLGVLVVAGTLFERTHPASTAG